MQYIVEEINQKNKEYHNSATDSFEVFGRLEATYQNKVWSYEEVLYDEPYNKSYEKEAHDLDEYIANPAKAIFYALRENIIIGQIIIKENWNGFCYIDSISVAKSARGNGIASSLIEEAQKWALKSNLKGFMLETQDVNLGACRLYIKNDFLLGSVDTMLYQNFKTKEEQALIWYKLF